MVLAFSTHHTRGQLVVVSTAIVRTGQAACDDDAPTLPDCPGAVLAVLREATAPLSPTEVRDALLALGTPYPLGTVRQALKRLASRGVLTWEGSRPPRFALA